VANSSVCSLPSVSGSGGEALDDVAPRLLSQVLNQCGEARIRVSGTSMLPSIRPADVLHIRSVDISDVQPDEVILFEMDRRLFAHRVVRADAHGLERVLITRGDMHSHDDPPVAEAQLRGRVEAQLRDGVVIVLGQEPRRGSRRRWSGVSFACLCRMHLLAQAMRSFRPPAH
jgi:signal peptidase I